MDCRDLRRTSWENRFGQVLTVKQAFRRLPGECVAYSICHVLILLGFRLCRLPLSTEGTAGRTGANCGSVPVSSSSKSVNSELKTQLVVAAVTCSGRSCSPEISMSFRVCIRSDNCGGLRVNQQLSSWVAPDPVNFVLHLQDIPSTMDST
jgi:hypothetical protein